MKKKAFGLVLPVIMTGILAGISSASAENLEKSGIPGITNDTRSIAVDIQKEPVGDAIQKLCQKAGWGLVLNASAEELEKSVSVVLPEKKPAGNVLKMILSGSNLKASFEDGVLHITDAHSLSGVESDVLSDGEIESDKDGDARLEKEEYVVSSLKEFRDKFHDKWDRGKSRKKKRHSGSRERVEIGEPVTIGEDESVTTAVSVGGSTTVAGEVEEDAVSVGGDLVIRKNSHVGRDAVSVGGNVSVESGAKVKGDVVSVGGKVTVADDAIVEGDRVSVNIPIPALGGLTGILSMAGVFWLLAAFLRSFFIFVIALFIVWLAPDRVETARQHIEKRFGWSLLSGLLIVLAFVPLAVVLAVTIIGIPLIPLLVLFLVAVAVFGLAALLCWMGYLIPVFKKGKSSIGALIIGFLVFLLLNMIPVFGGIVMLVSIIAAAGATFLSRFGKKGLDAS